MDSFPEYETAGIETIARGVCVKDGHILICRNREVGNLYFPGGHIEFGETGAEALEREVREEMGLESSAKEFLGCCEHRFDQHGKPHAEINLVYALEIPSVAPGQTAPSCEDWIAFDWMPFDELASSAVEPAALRDHVLEWYDKRGVAADRLAVTEWKR